MTSGLTTPLAAQVEEWRRQALAGTLTTEQMREIITQMRQGRVAAAATSKSTKAKSKVDVDAIIGDLEAL